MAVLQGYTTTSGPAWTVKRTNTNGNDLMHVEDPNGVYLVLDAVGNLILNGGAAVNSLACSGQLNNYNGQACADQGIPAILSSVHATAQAATIASTPLFTAATNQMWHCDAYIYETTSGAGTVVGNVVYNNGASQTVPIGTITTSASGSFAQNSFNFFLPAGSVASYNTTAGTLSGKYDLHISLQRLY